MNADERTPGQQGYGQQSPQGKDGRQQTSGEQTQQQTLGQQQPIGQQQQAEALGQGGQSSTGQASYGNSGDTDTLSQNSSSLGQDSDLGQSQGGSGLFSGSQDDMGGSDSEGQQFASDGQGAADREDDGTTDIEIERSQGRESDIEGSSL